jgi:hypothetical protein
LGPFNIIPSVFREKFPTAEIERYRQKLLAGKKKENSQIFNEDFYLPLYLPLCRFLSQLATEINRDYPRSHSLQWCARTILTVHRETLTQYITFKRGEREICADSDKISEGGTSTALNSLHCYKSLSVSRRLL